MCKVKGMANETVNETLKELSWDDLSDRLGETEIFELKDYRFTVRFSGMVATKFKDSPEAVFDSLEDAALAAQIDKAELIALAASLPEPVDAAAPTSDNTVERGKEIGAIVSDICKDIPRAQRRTVNPKVISLIWAYNLEATATARETNQPLVEPAALKEQTARDVTAALLTADPSETLKEKAVMIREDASKRVKTWKAQNKTE